MHIQFDKNTVSGIQKLMGGAGAIHRHTYSHREHGGKRISVFQNKEVGYKSK
jgi:hypothetical protein